jgi:hypothetical protein
MRVEDEDGDMSARRRSNINAVRERKREREREREVGCAVQRCRGAASIGKKATTDRG